MTPQMAPTEYPIIRPSDGPEYLNRLKAQWTPGDTPANHVSRQDAPISKADAGQAVDLTVIHDLRTALHEAAKEFPPEIYRIRGSRNAFDLEAANIVFQHAVRLPLAVRLDKDFWRYLALQELFEVIIWRIPDSGKDAWPSNFGVGSNWARCYPYKAYLRGQLIQEVRDAGYPWKDIEDVDFYDSHLFGRRNGLIAPVASALNSIRSGMTNGRHLDPFATTATRYRAMHVTEMLEPNEAEALIRRYTASTTTEGTGTG